VKRPIRLASALRSAAPALAGFVALVACTASTASAEDCEALQASSSPILLRGTSIMMQGTKLTPGVISFRVTRGKPVKVVQMAGPQDEPIAELWFDGILTTRAISKGQKVTEYEYPKVEGSLTEGTELRYTRVVKQDGASTSTETGVVRIGHASARMIGACSLEAMEIESEVRAGDAPVRVVKLLYAPRLGFFLKSDASTATAAGHVGFTYTVDSLEPAP